VCFESSDGAGQIVLQFLELGAAADDFVAVDFIAMDYLIPTDKVTTADVRCVPHMAIFLCVCLLLRHLHQPQKACQ
jgi:hypothetical protein